MSAWLRTSRDAKKPFSDLATTTVATTQRAVRNPPAFQRFGGEAKDLNLRPLGYEYIAPPHHPLLHPINRTRSKFTRPNRRCQSGALGSNNTDKRRTFCRTVTQISRPFVAVLIFLLPAPVKPLPSAYLSRRPMMQRGRYLTWNDRVVCDLRLSAEVGPR